MSSKKRKRKQKSGLMFDPTLTPDGPRLAQNGEIRITGSRVKHAPLQFEEKGNVRDLDEEDRKRRLAIMLSMRERENAPYCECCNLRKCQKIGEGPEAPYDAMCGACSRETMERPKAVRRHAGLTGVEQKLRQCFKCGERNKGEMQNNPNGIGLVWVCVVCHPKD